MDRVLERCYADGRDLVIESRFLSLRLSLGGERRDDDAERQNDREDGPWSPHTSPQSTSRWLSITWGLDCQKDAISDHTLVVRPSNAILGGHTRCVMLPAGIARAALSGSSAHSRTSPQGIPQDRFLLDADSTGKALTSVPRSAPGTAVPGHAGSPGGALDVQDGPGPRAPPA